MVVERLVKRFPLNVPIFTSEILDVMQDYSSQRVYQLLREAEASGGIVRYDSGVYYLPKNTEFGRSVLPVESVIEKKYIRNGEDIFGIYGKYAIDLNFFISTQVPNVIEVITNNEARRVREIEIKGRRVILRRSRIKITSKNAAAYTLMELFSGIDVRRYQEDRRVRAAVIDYIERSNITREDILRLADVFPSKAMKNMVISEVLYEIAR